MSSLNLPFVSESLTIFKAIGDGSCFFHSVLLGTNKAYGSMDYDRRCSVARRLRAQLAERLVVEYDRLSRGKLRELAAEGYPGASLRELRQLLDSSQWVGVEFIELVSNLLGIDIYLIDVELNDVYSTSEELKTLFHKDRPSLIIAYHRAGHYDLVGQVRPDRRITLWAHDHHLVKSIRSRLRSKCKTSA